MRQAYSIGVSNRDASQTGVRQGTLDLLVLQTVDAPGPMHGYAIASRLEQVSRSALQLNMGTLYPALMRLEQRGLLRGAWSTTENNRKARLYSPTAAGKRELAQEKQAWTRWALIVDAVLRGDTWCLESVIRSTIRGRRIPPGGVAHRSLMPNKLALRALPAGRGAPRLMPRITDSGH